MFCTNCGKDLGDNSGGNYCPFCGVKTLKHDSNENYIKIENNKFIYKRKMHNTKILFICICIIIIILSYGSYTIYRSNEIDKSITSVNNYLDQGNIEKARDILDTKLSKYIDSEKLYIAYAQLYVNQDDFINALKIIETGIDKSMNKTELELIKTEIENNYKEQIENFEYQLQLEEDYNHSRSNLNIDTLINGGLSEDAAYNTAYLFNDLNAGRIESINRNPGSQNYIVKTQKGSFIISYNKDSTVYSIYDLGNQQLYENNQINYNFVFWDTYLDFTLKNYIIECIKKALISPTTAKFPGNILNPFDDWKVSRASEGNMQYEAYVDSQNIFGAMIRNYFICQLSGVGDNAIRMTYLEIDGIIIAED